MKYLFATILVIVSVLHISTSTLAHAENDWLFPADGVVSDVFLTREGRHKGIDIAGEENSPVFAAATGTVYKSYQSSSYGNVIMLRHENGYETVYAHLNHNYVEEGQVVQQGEVIGTMGNTGESTGTHLHFEMHQGQWTPDKENVIDPFVVFERHEIGERIYSLQPTEEVVEVARTTMSYNDGSKPILIPSYPTYEPGQQKEFRSAMVSSDLLNGDIKRSDKEENKSLSYIVKKGDTLWSLATTFNTTVEGIQKENDLTSDLIVLGQTLTINQTE